jgi:hypothetical protein
MLCAMTPGLRPSQQLNPSGWTERWDLDVVHYRTRQHGRWKARLRCATVLDIALHAGLATVLVVVLGHRVAAVGANPVPAWVVGYVLVSLVHRVLVQRLFSATLGKLLVGIRLVRRDSGRRADLLRLLIRWLMSALAVVVTLLPG